MKEAIQKAIEGGWKPFGSVLYKNFIEQKWSVPEVYANFYHQPTWLLDPKFWQCLGKEMEWSDGVCSHLGMCRGKCPESKIPSWLFYWHKFIDHLAEGKKSEEFFKQFLT